MWFKLTGDARIGRCATEGCGGQPTERLEAGGIASNYCSGCREKIESGPTDRQSEIYGCFDGLADIYPHQSTEFLLQLTADTMKCSYEDVCSALQAYTESEARAT
jgi:hypothetical protein